MIKININITNCAKLSKLELSGFTFNKKREYNKFKIKLIAK